jgi:hypothetical protein
MEIPGLLKLRWIPREASEFHSWLVPATLHNMFLSTIRAYRYVWADVTSFTFCQCHLNRSPYFIVISPHIFVTNPHFAKTRDMGLRRRVVWSEFAEVCGISTGIARGSSPWTQFYVPLSLNLFPFICLNQRPFLMHVTRTLYSEYLFLHMYRWESPKSSTFHLIWNVL